MKTGCWFRENFGLYCAGCGGTRMVKALLRLDFYQAFRYNPLVFVLLVLIGIWACFNIYRLIIHKKIYWPSERVWIIFAGIVILYMIMRNIPLFDFLIPTNV